MCPIYICFPQKNPTSMPMSLSVSMPRCESMPESKISHESKYKPDPMLMLEFLPELLCRPVHKFTPMQLLRLKFSGEMSSSRPTFEGPGPL